ncbi:MAG: sialate O-acetylesterase [Candidatus Hinthialibacter antarcticus]|nr:sialate O-acetylesterase [Candidatus Hinthialibacter antarcticus]
MKSRTALQMLSVMFAFAFCLTASYADVKPNALFSDHMVLQQGKTIHVWGTANPGEKVTVQLDRQKKSTKTGDNGEWKVALKKMTVGGPYELTISGDNTITYNNVMLGEVWVCSGQSNMQWTVSNSNNPDYEIKMANYPNIRLFYVPRVSTGEPQKNVNAKWEVCNPSTIPGFSAVAYFFGRELNTRLNVPIGLIHTSWGGTPAEAWTRQQELEDLPIASKIVEDGKNKLANYPNQLEKLEQDYLDWKERAQLAEYKGDPVPEAPRIPDDFRRHPWRPSGLYNAMIAPLIPFGIQGAIWYQGESNAGRAYQYRELFPTMIQSWRNAWDQGDFPFYFVQLANFKPGGGNWPELREAQTMTLSLPNTGMAVTTDIGNPVDIHPRNKQDVGKRLALVALAQDYGHDIVYSGPMYKAMEVKGNSVALSFDHLGSGMVTLGGDTLNGFIIAGSDKEFHPASAKIEGDKVIVSSDAVSSPVAVRYAWTDNPEEANLFNKEGLPASSFRTDEWPGQTVDNR